MPEPDFQSTLVGPTIIIRPIAPVDWTDLYAAGSDPKIRDEHQVAAKPRTIHPSSFRGRRARKPFLIEGRYPS